ncbi:MAG: hypothetical protein A2W26_03730 [Acidobacteria bacterium RBG_16_64_8]|nr:MAG: hypothetical protein A2W26_03730 [Acidobacteria bacterium RBG_16_64_8]
MPLFRPSSKGVSAVCQEIADTVGASADNETTTKALRSLNAATKYFNSKAKWNFLYTEATLSAVIAPFSVAVSASSQEASASAVVGHGIAVDDFIAGEQFVVGTRVTATGTTGFGFSPALTAFAAGISAFNITVNRDFYALPSDFRTPYSVRLLSTNKPLVPITRRYYDRQWSSQFTVGTVEGYDMFQLGAKGKVRLVPPPAGADVLDVRYYRAMATASASAQGTVLDLPSDYDDYLVSWAKWHFLMDKSEGRSQQGQTWLALAQEGLKTMLSDQTNQPDEEIAFVPGHASWPYGPNSTWTAFQEP